jgi:hypothetical protein
VANAKAQRLSQQAQEAGIRLRMDMATFNLEMEERLANIAKVKAETILAIAKAKDLDTSDSMEMLKHQLNQITSQAEMESKMLMEQVKQLAGGNGNVAGGASPDRTKSAAVPRLAEPSGNTGSPAGVAAGAGGVDPAVS